MFEVSIKKQKERMFVERSQKAERQKSSNQLKTKQTDEMNRNKHKKVKISRRTAEKFRMMIKKARF